MEDYLLLFDIWQWCDTVQHHTTAGFVSFFGEIQAVLLVSKFTVLQFSKAGFLKYIPDSRSTENSPFMVDGPDRGSSMSAITSQSSRLSFHLLICTDGSFLSHCAVFSFQSRRDFGGYLVWLSHPPPVLIPAHAMKQNTGDMSGSKALSGCQKHLPKYLHLLLLFIHRQCGSLDLLLVFGGTSTFPIFPHSEEG